MVVYRSQLLPPSGLVLLLTPGFGQSLAEGRSAEQCKPEGETAPMPHSARAYAAMCQPELGVAPTVDCGQGARIRIRKDGKEFFENPGLHGCDEASLQIGDCMPPHDPGSLAEDLEALEQCWLGGPENTPGCEWVVPPAGGCSGGPVGPAYPHAAQGFNRGPKSGKHCSG